MATVLIVDDEAPQRAIMKSILTGEKHNLYESDNVNDALEQIYSLCPGVVLTDLKMPGKGGLDIVAAIAKMDNPPEVVVITAFGTIETAVKAMQLGAYDYLTKPIERDELVLIVQRAAEKYALRISASNLHNELVRQAYDGLIAESAAMKGILEMAQKVAASDATVFIRGDTGTGKERIARLIHYISPRGNKSMQSINCAAFPETLLESELFGYEKGAFTGAYTRKIGIVEAANESSLFLDEVADMALSTQAKILRVLQEKEIRRLGNTTPITVNIRIIAATNKNLEECIKNGTFREDLFYRLNIIPLKIPPLRSRPDDIPALALSFLLRRSKGKTITQEALTCLSAYTWPGNVRELEAVMERVSILSKTDTIDIDDLSAEIRLKHKTPPDSANILPEEGIVFDEWERSLLEQALIRSKGVMTEAAKLLGMTYRTFQYRAEKFGIGKQE